MTVHRVVYELSLPATFFGSLSIWRVVKQLASALDSEEIWDGADILCAFATGVVWIPLQYSTLSRAPIDNPLGVSITHGLGIAASLLFLFLYLSLYWEQETDWARPESLEPAGDRIWKSHFLVFSPVLRLGDD